MKDSKNIEVENQNHVNDLSIDRNYWNQKLSGEFQKCSLPYDYINNGTHDKKINTLSFNIDIEESEKILKMSNDSNSKLLMILLAGISVLINKLTNNKRVIFGSPIYKQEVSGDFFNQMLALQCFFNNGMSFKDLLISMRTELLESLKHQNYSIKKLEYDLGFEDGDEVFNLFDIAVALENIQTKDYINVPINILFLFKNNDNKLTGSVEYNTELYNEKTIEDFIKRLQILFKELLSDIDRNVDDISLLYENEHLSILNEFNNTKHDYPSNKTIIDLIEEQAIKTPENIALKFDEAEITYTELIKRVNTFASFLSKKGVNVNSIVPLMGKRTIEMVISILSILKAGGAYLPINAKDPLDRILFILKNSEAKLLLIQKKVLDEMHQLEELFSKDNIIQIDELPESGNFNENIINKSYKNLAYIIYTSGTTGNPKGVMIEHNSLVNYISWVAKEHIGENKYNMPFYTSFSFDMSVTSIFTPLITGNTIFIYGGDEKEFILGRVINDNLCEIIKVTPSHLKMLRNSKLDDFEFTKRGEDIKIRKFIVGGEQLYTDLANDIYKLFNKQIEIVNEYGPTEATVGCMIHRFNPEKDKRVSIPIGKPANNARIYVLNENQQLLPVGVEGEMYIAGSCLARGYLKNDELTSQKFIQDPFFENEKMYKTGDLAKFISNEKIEYVDRADNQIKIRGFRVELGEIEYHIKLINGVSETVVIPIFDDNRNVNLCAYYISNEEIASNILRQLLIEKIPDYMIPSYFVKINKIPLTSGGKINIKELPKPKIEATEEYIAPSTEIEEKLAKIWAEVLKVEIENIGVLSNFFELGGHSLSATILTTKIHKEFNVKIKLVEIFDNPNIRGLAKKIEKSQRDIFVEIQAASKKKHYQASSAQEKMYFLQQLSEESTFYNLPFAFIMEGNLNKDKFEFSFRKLVERHESFRTSFKIVDDEVKQIIHDDIKFDIKYYESSETEARNIMKDLVKPFNLEEAPLLRVGLIKIGASRYVMMMDMHHIITDGDSMNLIINEFKELYKGKELPDLTIQYKDYAEWHNKELTKDYILNQEKFWIQQFQKEAIPLDLPIDYERPDIQAFEGAKMVFEVGDTYYNKINQIIEEDKVTLFMMLLTTYNLWLSNISGQSDIVVGTPISGRRHADLEQIVGMFLNTLALRSKPSKEKSFYEFLKEVKNSTINAFDNQDYPFEMIVDKIITSRETGRNSLFDTMFTLQNIEPPQMDDLGISFQPYNLENNNSKFDLSLMAIDGKNKIMFVLEYNSKIFKPETIQLLKEKFILLLDQVLNNKHIKISEIDLRTDVEKELSVTQKVSFNL